MTFYIYIWAYSLEVFKRRLVIPLHLSAPQDVLFVIHEDREVLVFALLYGI